jgi:hypothetical protein
VAAGEEEVRGLILAGALIMVLASGCSQSQSSSTTTTANSTTTIVAATTTTTSTATTSTTIATYAANCLLKGLLNVTNDFSGDIKFLGEIQNTGNRQADYVKITFTLKNTGGSVLETPYTYVNNTDIPSGETDSFTCWTSTASTDVSSYTYKISWSNH